MRGHEGKGMSAVWERRGADLSWADAWTILGCGGRGGGHVGRGFFVDNFFRDGLA